MFVASTTHRRAPHARRAARQAVASGVVCAHQSSRCTLTKTNCHSKTTNRFHHRNQQYSVVALTDVSSAIAERYAYSAYGEPVITNASGTVLPDSEKDNRYTYTGREWDEELSLYHFRARMYDAESGRFCERDPMMLLSGDFYSSPMNVSALDPSGQISVELKPEYKLENCNKSGCGTAEQRVDIKLGRVTGDVNLRATFAIVQQICTKRFGNYCDSECGDDCKETTKEIPKMDCCHNELIGFVEVWATQMGKPPQLLCIGPNGTGVAPCEDGKIEDRWDRLPFDKIKGPQDCHSKGESITSTKVLVIEVAGWDEIWEMGQTYKPGRRDCGDQYVIMGPGPTDGEIRGRVVVGRAKYSVKGDWNCCPRIAEGFDCRYEFSNNQALLQK